MRELMLEELSQVAGGSRTYDSCQDPDGSEIYDYYRMWDSINASIAREQRAIRTAQNPVMIDWNGDGQIDEQGYIDDNGRLIGLSGTTATDYIWRDNSWESVHNSVDPTRDPNGDYSAFWEALRNGDNMTAFQNAPGMLANFMDHLVREGRDNWADYVRDRLFGSDHAVPVNPATPTPGYGNGPVNPVDVPQYPVTDQTP